MRGMTNLVLLSGSLLILLPSRMALSLFGTSPSLSLPLANTSRFLLILPLGLSRERDTTVQLIGTVDEVIELVKELVSGSIDWAEGSKRLPAYTGEQEL